MRQMTDCRWKCTVHIFMLHMLLKLFGTKVGSIDWGSGRKRFMFRGIHYA